MPPDSLQPTTDEILARCPRFRVLVVGKSGVGKSSLISYAFGIDMKATTVSRQQRGQCNINEEIATQQNPRFVLHDSMGFEHGDLKNYETVKTFLETRNGPNSQLPERVHVIWLCVQVPHAGGRVFETGDEHLLQLATKMKVPVIVVFTQFDMLLDSINERIPDDEADNMSEDDIDAYCAKEAEIRFHELCIKPLERIDPALHFARSGGLSGAKFAKPHRGAVDALVKLTGELVEKLEGDTWIVSAMAQRASAQVKINASIAVGLKRYWEGLASGTNFTGWTLEGCLQTIHKEMVDSWNFYDPDDLLIAPAFLDRMKKLAQLVTPNETEAKSWFPNIESIQSLVGLVIGASVAAAVGPAVGAIALSVWFVKFVADVYRKTPETLRCFMGYIIDLTLVLDQLFLLLLPRKAPRHLTLDDIDMALESYKAADLGRVHREIRQYVQEAEWKAILASNTAEGKVKELIWKYSADFKG